MTENVNHTDMISSAAPPLKFAYKIKKGSRPGFYITGVYKNVSFNERLVRVDDEEVSKVAQRI